MSVVIDSARIDDAAAIAGVHISSLPSAYQGHIPEHVLSPPDMKRRTQHWKGWLRRSQVSTLVARVGGRVTGFCTLHPIRDEAAQGVTGEIAAIYVLPSHWRRGIGRLLCEQTMVEARTRGVAEVVLWVFESNERALRFYASQGFRPDSKMRVFHERSNASLYELRYRRSTSVQSNVVPSGIETSPVWRGSR